MELKSLKHTTSHAESPVYWYLLCRITFIHFWFCEREFSTFGALHRHTSSKVSVRWSWTLKRRRKMDLYQRDRKSYNNTCIDKNAYLNWVTQLCLLFHSGKWLSSNDMKKAKCFYVSYFDTVDITGIFFQHYDDADVCLVVFFLFCFVFLS